MKKSSILLNQLYNLLSKNPSIWNLLPWDDIHACMYIELDAFRPLLSPESFDKLTHSVESLINETKKSDNQPEKSIETIHLLQCILDRLPDTETTRSKLEYDAFTQAKQRHYSENTICVIGDSHVNFFSGNENLSFKPIGHDINTCHESPGFHWPFTPLHLGPCLAYTCDMADSRSGFLAKSEYLMENFITPNATIILVLGEIDLRVHVYKHAKENSIGYQPVVDEILSHYYQFILQSKKRGYNVCCWGPIATQPDSCTIDSRYPRCGTEQSRNLATKYFNDQLRNFCVDQSLPFMTVFYDMVTSDNQTKTQFLSPDKCHLSQSALSIAVPQWKKHLFNYQKQ